MRRGWEERGREVRCKVEVGGGRVGGAVGGKVEKGGGGWEGGEERRGIRE